MTTLADIEAAERILGIAYTANERSQMVGNLVGQIKSARARRAVPLSNTMPMASRFDPRLPSFRMPAPQGPLRFSAPEPSPVPRDDSDVAFAPVRQLSAWLASGALTSRRLTEIYLSRIEEFGPRLECFAMTTPQLALAEADAADALLRAGVNLGPLHGIPYGLKDLFDTKGIVTGWGAEPFRDRVPDTDASVVRKLRTAGAVLLGKTAVGALAYNEIWYGGRVRNPWNLNEGLQRIERGLSLGHGGGSMCFFDRDGDSRVDYLAVPALRDDGPAPDLRAGLARGRDGVVLVARQGGTDLPIGRGYRDGARRHQRVGHRAIALRSRRLSISTRAPASRGCGSAIFPKLSVRVRPKSTIARSMPPDGSGSRLSEISLPDLPYGALMNIVYAEAAAAFEDLTLDDLDDTLTWQDDGAWPNTFRKARFLSAVDHVQLDRLRYQVMLALDAVFQQVDAVIGPFMTGPMLIASNFTGHPCVHLRAGFLELGSRGAASLASGKITLGEADASGRTFRVPQGISLWGRLFEEGPILNLGMALERELGVARSGPPFASRPICEHASSRDANSRDANMEKDFRQIARKTNPKPTAPPAGARLNSLTGR